MTDLFQDTNTEACSLPSVAERAIAEAPDVFAFAAVYDHPNVAVFGPMVLESVDLGLRETEKKRRRQRNTHAH